MTKEQWLKLKVGDVIIDHKCGDREREVLTVRRIVVRRGCIGPHHTRVTITVHNARDSKRIIPIFSADDWHGGVGKRFTLKEKT